LSAIYAQGSAVDKVSFYSMWLGRCL